MNNLNFNEKKGFICDMDGVIYHGNQILPGVADFIKWLHDENKEFLFLTNNSGYINASEFKLTTEAPKESKQITLEEWEKIIDSEPEPPKLLFDNYEESEEKPPTLDYSPIGEN